MAGGRAAAFIDVASLYKAARELGVKRLEYSAIKEYLDKEYEGRFIRPYVYLSLNPDGKLEKLVRYLRRTGYTVTSRIYDERFTTSLATWMAMDIVDLSERLDTVVLFALDPTMVPVVEWLKKRMITVVLVSHKSITSAELLDMVDQHVQVADIPNIVGSGDDWA
jgi:uncharacterized LabA/DUF88 family protein